MSESIQEMENRWALLMAATDPKTGQRVYERDGKYAREVHALRVQIEERKAAETSRPQISQQQLDQLAWLDRAKGARGQDGKPLLFDMGEKGRTFRKNIDAVQQRLASGQSVPDDLIANTERNFAAQGFSIPASAPDRSAIIQQRVATHAGGFLPPAAATQLGGGATVTGKGPQS